MSAPDTSHAPSSPADRIPLSPQHEFFCELDKGDLAGAFGVKHIIAFGWRLRGEIDVDALRAALDDVVARHEMLRTSILRGTDTRYRTLRSPGPVKLLVRDLTGTAPGSRDLAAEEFFNEVEGGVYSTEELPHLRAFLGRFDDRDAALILLAHHISSDGWSMQVILRDLAACYAARREHRAPDLPDVRQYSEYAVWQQESWADPAVRTSREYWREKLRGARILALPTDRPPTDSTAVYSTYRFLVESDITSAAVTFSRVMRCSPFMVLLAAYNVLLQKLTGSTDVVVPTFTSGRGPERFHDTVGPFLNFLPLRTELAGCETFREVVERTRATCIEAYTHDISFAQIESVAPDLMRPFADDNLDVVAFEVLQFPPTAEGTAIGGLEYTEMRRRLLSQPVSSDIPDGALWAMDILQTGDMVGSLKFNTNLFDQQTMSDMVRRFRTVLRDAVAAPDSPLTRI